MKISLSWLQTYLKTTQSPQELATTLTRSGIEVKSIISTGSNLSNVVAAQILSSDPHPNADRLSVCIVDDGSGHQRQIVCGAKNYHVGDKVLLALPGALLPGGVKIKIGKLRGVESEGMMCSSQELGLGSGASGLHILPAETILGTEVQELFPSDTILELEVTPNRPDWLGHIGVAREAAAFGAGELTRIFHTDSAAACEHLMDTASASNCSSGSMKHTAVVAIHHLPCHHQDSRRLATNQYEICGLIEKSHIYPLLSHQGPSAPRVMDAHACPFYSVRLFDLIQVTKASSLLSRRLESIGVRSINNIVDITNYVMMETGQPLHAFDAKKIQGTLTVRFARPGEILEALDGVTYHLRSSDLIIADEKEPQALAGILGGMTSGVRESTESILLESAVFNPTLIRASASFHGLRTDASYRFERGSHAAVAINALEHATSLIKECSQNVVVHEVAVIGSLPPATLLSLRYDRVRNLLGVSLEDEEISSLLTKIGCTPCEHGWRIPSWRLDLTREVDLIEEVIRLYGIERISPRYFSIPSESSLADRDYDGMMLLRRRLVASGFCEVRTNALVAPEVSSLKTIRLHNPMGEEQSGLRTSLLPGLKAVIQYNLCQGAKGLKIFELGKVFVKCAENTSAQEESLSLGLMMTGEAESSSWRGGVRRSLDLYDLKGALDALLPGKITYHPSVRPLPEVMAIAMDLFCDDLYCGYIGCLSPKEARKFMLSGQNDALIVAQLELTPLLQALHHGAWKKEGPLPIFPSMTRDLAVVVEKSISYHALEEVLLAQQEPCLKKILPVDIFTDDTGEKISAQHKSLTLQLTFQDEHRTLTTQEVNIICERMIAVLKESFDLAIRS